MTFSENNDLHRKRVAVIKIIIGESWSDGYVYMVARSFIVESDFNFSSPQGF